MLGTVLGPSYTISDIKDPVEKRDDYTNGNKMFNATTKKVQ